MTAYRRVYDSRHLQADCQEPESALAVRSVLEYGLPLPFYEIVTRKNADEDTCDAAVWLCRSVDSVLSRSTS